MAENLVRLGEFVQGGLLDDADVEITDARFTRWDYDGQSDEVTALKLTMRRESDDSEVEQYFSVGGGADDAFMPSDDEYHLKAVGGKTTLNTNSNYHLLFMSFVENGMEEDQFDGEEGVSSLVGTRGHVLRKPDPRQMDDLPGRRRGRVKEGEEEDDSKRRDEVRKYLCFDSISRWGWEEEGGKKSRKKATRKTAAKSKASKAKADDAEEEEEESGESLEDVAEKAVIKALISNGEGMEEDDLKIAVFQSLKRPKKDKSAITKMITDKFLAGIDAIEKDDDGLWSAA